MKNTFLDNFSSAKNTFLGSIMNYNFNSRFNFINNNNNNNYQNNNFSQFSFQNSSTEFRSYNSNYQFEFHERSYSNVEFFQNRFQHQTNYPNGYLSVNRPWQFESERESNLNEKKEKNSKTDDADVKNESKTIIKLCSYNLLAPGLLRSNSYLYMHINQLYLDWDYRKKLLIKQFSRLNADIFCFQEMEENDFKYFFMPKLSKKGYACYYKKRFGEDKTDGCFICFKTKKFELLKEVPVDYYNPDVEILNRGNVGLILLLKLKLKHDDAETEEKRLVVATTHILFNPRRGDCKLAQMQVLLAHIDKLAFKKSKIIENKIFPEYYPTILCGDFNFSNNSKLYEFVKDSKLTNYKDLSRNMISGLHEYNRSNMKIENTLLPEEIGISDQSQFKIEVDKRLAEINSDSNLEAYCTFGGTHLRHTFRFNSVYDHIVGNQLEVTTCIKDQKKTVDFIFFHSENKEIIDTNKKVLDGCFVNQPKLSGFKRRRDSDSTEKEKKQLELICKLRLFTVPELSEVSLPNKDYPSDHFILAAKFALN